VIPGLTVAVALLVASAASARPAQTPQPFPRPSAPQGERAPAPPVAAPAPASRPAPTPAAAQPAAPPAQQAVDPNAPSAATLVFPVYPGARFLASYDAGREQRYHLFGTTTPYAEVVLFYRTQLKERGDEIYQQPATHMFQVGRFREETMAFPPGVTVKDWTSGGSQGYPNPKLGSQPARFPTVIMIVPPPPVAAAPNTQR
jgi:hypothetical protein